MSWIAARDRELRKAVLWARETFPDATLRGKVTHLLREVDELEAAPDSSEEMADCAILLAAASDLVIQHAAERGVNLGLAVRDKMKVLRAREWGEPDAEGVIEHLREEADR